MHLTITIEITNNETGNPLTARWREEAEEQITEAVESIELSFTKENANQDEFTASVGINEIK